MKKILKIIIIIIFIIVGVIIIKNKNSINNNLLFRTLIVKSNSMYPILSKGDIILIKKSNNYKKGDIITYEDENFLITHRVIEIKDNYFCTKGDNNNSEDNDLISLENVKGKVILIINRSCQIYISLLFIVIVLFVFFKSNKEA